MIKEDRQVSRMTDLKVTVSRQGEKFLANGQAWMYRSNLLTLKGTEVDGGIADIIGEDGNYIATGFYSAVSHIAVRILTRRQGTEIDENFFEKRIRKAWEFRKTVEKNNLTNCRIIFGDADGLPGLTVDRYNDVLSVQILCSGMESRKQMIYRLLMSILQEDGENISGIYERFDVKGRTKEGLKLYKEAYQDASFSTDQIISENGLKLHVDIANGQKTGYFLDQKSNRMLIRNIATGKKVCDCFTHTGGFALNAAFGGAVSVTAVDVSASALAEGKANAELNGLTDCMDFVQADVFEYLDHLEKGEFDLIILDPPAFTKSRRTVEHAYHGYLSINEKAMNILRDGGYLATCSCSRYMETELFEKMLREAARSQGVLLKQISVTQQNADHPILWQMDETSYLKFFLFQIVENL